MKLYSRFGMIQIKSNKSNDTLTSLCGFPSLKTWIVSLVQIAVIMLIWVAYLRRRSE